MDLLLDGQWEAASALVGVALAPDLHIRSETLLQLRLADIRADPNAEAWLLRVIALRTEGGPMVGLTGFHGRPDLMGTAEVGYEIDPAYRRRGYATEATAALVRWALREGGARRVVAAIRPANHASLAVVRGLGFTNAGSRWDVLDGAALVLECRTPPAAPAPPTEAPMTLDGDGAKMRQHPGA